MNSNGGYFLVRKDDKKCGEYKNENWVRILRSDSYKKAIFSDKKWQKMGNVRMKIRLKMAKNW